MIEYPESANLAKQVRENLTGKLVARVITGQSPHKFTFYWEDEAKYDELLKGKSLTGARHYGGRLDILFEDMVLDVFDGVNFCYAESVDKVPKKHQLLIEFEDGTALAASVAMYGGLFVFRDGDEINFYYDVAREKPDPLSDSFSSSYFDELLKEDVKGKLSAKAFLATEQRIPGLGNGVLQDILWRAGIHPKAKVSKLGDSMTERMFYTVKTALAEMTASGGRDTEKDIYRRPGGYATVMSKSNKQMLCPACGEGVRKEAYLGGSVYYCPVCQPEM